MSKPNWPSPLSLNARSPCESSCSFNPCRNRSDKQTGPENLNDIQVLTGLSASTRCIDHDPGRWSILIHAIHQFPEVVFFETVEALRLELGNPQEGSAEIWDHLRKEVNRHKAFAETDWALKNKPLAALDALVTEYAPKNPVLLSTWLFDDWLPDVPGTGDGSIDPTEGVERARAAAIADVYSYGGIAGLVELAGKVKLPQHVAHSARALHLVQEELAKLLHCALQTGEALDQFASVVLAESVQRFGADGEASMRAEVEALGLDPARVGRLLLALPENKATWDFAASFGGAVEDAYWRIKHSYFVDGSADEMLLAIDQYARRGRFLAALDASSRRLKEVPTLALMGLLGDAIPEINAKRGEGGNMTLYILERAFDELALRNDVPLEDVAQLEFAYLPVFRVRKKQLVLHRLMVEKASLFVEAVSAVFKPENGEARTLDEAGQLQAVAVYELLEGLQTLPGQTGNQIDVEKLLAWCFEVRELATKADRVTMTDQRIGHLFARAPASSEDGAWPHEAVRTAIEKLASAPLERGVEVERINMRGVYSKEMGEGGVQERDLAAEALKWAEAMPAYPRTMAMLRRISASWNRYAERADVEADEDALRW